MSKKFESQPEFWRTWFLVLKTFEQNDEAALRWFEAANQHLNNQAPAQAAQTANGAREVRELLEWIEVMK